MEPLMLIVLVLVLAITIVISGSIFAEPVIAWVRQRVPSFSYEAETFLIWGLVITAVFAAGFVVIYVLLQP